MAAQITLRDNATAGSIVSGNISNGVAFTSAEKSNTVQAFLYKAAVVTINYSNLVATGGVSFTGVVQGKTLAGTWFDVAYQFNSFQSTEFGRTDTVILDPNIFWSDAGVSNVIYYGGRTQGLVHPQQVALPDTWRFLLTVEQPSGSTFTSLDCSVFAELVSPQ